jgi:hypothetical protein
VAKSALELKSLSNKKSRTTVRRPAMQFNQSRLSVLLQSAICRILSDTKVAGFAR